MIHEFLRLSHIETEERLKDLNLTVFEGEILFLMSNHRGELEEIWQIIAGYKKIRRGALFLEEQPVKSYGEEIAAGYGIFHIDAGAQLVETLSIAENLYAIRSRKKLKSFEAFHRKSMEIITGEVLEEVGLSCEPETKIWQLDPFERFQVCLAKAVVNNAKLLMIDDVENEYNSSEKRRLRELILHFRGKGVASLILADRPGELLDGARKIVLIKNGRDIKTYFSQDKGYFSQEALYQTVTKAWLGVTEKSGQEAIEKKHDGDRQEPAAAMPSFRLIGKKARLDLYPGKIYGFYDGFQNKEKNMREYLADFEMVNYAGFEITFKGRETAGAVRTLSSGELLKSGQAVYVPKESAFLLLENVEIGKNIAIPNRKRAAKMAGISVNRIDTYLEAEFCRKFSIAPGTPVWDLNCMQKKILSIHRWLLHRPWLLILEEPTYKLNLQEADGLREYIRGQAKEGIVILVNESSFYEEEILCDEIIQTVRNEFQTTIKRKDFSKIKAEWLY